MPIPLTTRHRHQPRQTREISELDASGFAAFRAVMPTSDHGSTYAPQVLHELWEDPNDDAGYSLTLCLAGPRGEAARSLLSPSARLTWSLEAESHFQAMTLYYEHMGWGLYTSRDERDLPTYAELGWEDEGEG